MAAASKVITPAGRIRRLETKVERAGRPWNLDVNGLLAVKLMCLAGGLLILIILASLKVLPLIWFILLAAAVVILTYYLPDIILHFSANTRKQQIARSLPDFLDLLTVTVEAGLGLDSALAKISEKLRDPLREEILITLHHIRMGESREAALREFAKRCDVDDLSNFVTALIQSQKLGISLGTVLRVQSDTIRTVQRQRIEEKAQKAPGEDAHPVDPLHLPGAVHRHSGPGGDQDLRSSAGVVSPPQRRGVCGVAELAPI